MMICLIFHTAIIINRKSWRITIKLHFENLSIFFIKRTYTHARTPPPPVRFCSLFNQWSSFFIMWWFFVQMYLERTLSWFISRVFSGIFITAIFNYSFEKLYLISQVLSAVKSLPTTILKFLCHGIFVALHYSWLNLEWLWKPYGEIRIELSVLAILQDFTFHSFTFYHVCDISMTFLYLPCMFFFILFFSLFIQ